MQDTKFTPIKHSNKLLAFMDQVDWDRMQPRLEMVHLTVDQVLFEAGQKISHVYFPVTSIISQQYDFEDGKSAEFAQMGNEGLVGIFVFMGSQSTSSKAVVIAKGYAYRMRADAMLEEFNQSSGFRRLILRYMQVLMTHASQIAACNRRHSIDQQLSRTLLLNLDRVAGSELTFTRELIAKTMGVRREGISEAAKRLQRSGMIDYSRGSIQVLDRLGLGRSTCECYSIIKREYDRLLSPMTLQ